MIRNCIKITKFCFADFNSQKDYYKILGVSQNTAQADLKKAYLKLAKKYHPDSNAGQQSMFKEVNEAYQVLSSEKVKKEYDEARRYGSAGSQQQRYQASQPGYKAHNPNAQRNTYRGYQQNHNPNWNDPRTRQKIMEEIYRAQQGSYQKYGNYSQFYQNSGSTKEEFEEMIRRRNQNRRGFADIYEEHEQTVRRHQQQIRITKETVKKAYEQEQKRREKQFERYKDQKNMDLKKEMEERAHKMAEGIKENIEGIGKVGKFVKSIWEDLKKKK